MALTQERLKELIHYDPDTGVFTWRVRVNSKVPAGAVAGTLNVRGHIAITLKGKKWLAHRLAWLYVYGYLPTSILDHVDRTPTNNRIKNLREVTGTQNCLNQTLRSDNTTGIRGVSFDPVRGKWRAHLTLNGKHYNLGRFANKGEAVIARLKAEQSYGISQYCTQ